MAKKKKKKSFIGSLKKNIKNMKYWYIKDENDRVNDVARILFHGILITPFLLFEGIKVGFYEGMVRGGFSSMAQGLSVSAIDVYNMRHMTSATGFGNQYNGFDPTFLYIEFIMFFLVFFSLYTAAERNKNKSTDKDGDMKFGKISDFNEAMAYCDESGEPCEPPEDSSDAGNMILSKSVYYSLEPKGTNTYSCALVVGATGSGKSFTYVKPNILQMNSSYVITDPKGELTSDLGAALMRNGYNVKVFNINEPEYSCKYNPFKYIRCEADVVTAVNVFLENTKEQDAGGGDPFFPLAEKNFYLGLFFYIYTVYKDEPEKQSFKTLYEMYQKADEQETTVKKGEMIPESEFDKMFKELAKKDPSNPSLGYYATFKKGSPKTKQSILISVGVKLWFLSVGSIANLMSDDTLEFEKMGDRKTALFIIIPPEKDTYKCLSAMLFTQLFETLYYVGNTLNEKSFFVQKGSCIALRSDPFIAGTESEIKERERLEEKWNLWKRAEIEDDEELIQNDPKVAKYFNTPNELGFKPYPTARLVYKDPETGEKRVLEEFQSRAAAEMVLNTILNGEIRRGSKTLANHVRFMLDEFFSIGKIDGFDMKIATFRSLRISCDIIVQSMAQLKEMYEDREAKITNNCSIQILLGAASMDDCQYFSDMLGQATVKTESISINHKGLMQSSDGSNLSDNAQLLLRPEKIRTLNKDRCLIFVNTQLPLWDDKYSSTDHPKWHETYSSFDPINTANNQFQFRRLFYIKQEASNRIITIIKDDKPAQPALPDAQPKRHNQITGQAPANAEPSNAFIDKENQRLRMAELRNQRYEREMARRNYIMSQKSTQSPAKQVAESMQKYENAYGEVNIANLKDMGIDEAAEILLNAANEKGQPMWQTVKADTPGAIRIEPTKENTFAQKLKEKSIKETQVVSSAADAFDDDLWS